jgi:hypothetical protein
VDGLPGKRICKMTRDEQIRALDQRIRELNAELEGVPGAVLREVDMQAWTDKQAALQAAMREYYRLFYGDSVSMP